MKILIDNSNLFAGGGLQVAASFIRDLKKLGYNNEYYIVQSFNSSKELGNESFPENFTFINFSKKEEKSIFKRIKELKKIENTIKPDVIFTVFGPSYHKSDYKKIVGFAWGFVIYPNSPYFKKISFKTFFKFKILNFIKVFCFNKNSDALIFETDYSREYYLKNLNYKKETYVVSNTLNTIFNQKELHEDYYLKSKANYNILFLTANYQHKNLDLLPEIIEFLRDKEKKDFFIIHVSINEYDLEIPIELKKYVNFLGKVTLNELPSLYEQMDAVLMPSLLETFSTTYLEAMFMKKPLVVSDLEFARDICRDSAIYCTPTSSMDFANALYNIFRDKQLANTLVNNGDINLKRFGTSLDRTKKYLAILEKTINTQNKKWK
ncbi:hypothetical protein C3729_12470 [Cloacibacterium normanense]|uniref:Glycosyl transferases group 1 family protein n=1 Tax=Cloacibacterium normanense TaxID=237258 RepID=A0A2S7I1U5_9FLAO|nr:glycosyltransferase family 4 protein [Cloacibacterium normanense]PPZ90544.1 hypothetical protein C3729_12470 [Cloacibacterium normanense]